MFETFAAAARLAAQARQMRRPPADGLPMTPHCPLAYLPAHEQLARFRDKTLSPVEVLQAQIEQIDATDGTINAISCRHFDEALAAARASEARYQSGHPRRLEGITVALKDEYDKAGWITAAGSLVAEQAARQNHPVGIS